MKINSYILKPGHETVALKTYDDFINVKDSKKILEIEKDLDDFYLDGVIEIKNEKQIFLEINDWDLVDQLWSYILNLIEEYNESGESEIYFPDCPNKIKIKKMYDGYLMLSITTDQERRELMNQNEILGILLNEANVFFNSISILEDYKDYSLREIERVKKIKSDIKHAL